VSSCYPHCHFLATCAMVLLEINGRQESDRSRLRVIISRNLVAISRGFGNSGILLNCTDPNNEISYMNYCQKTTINLKYFLAGIIIFVVPCFCFAEPSLEEIKKEYKQKDLEGRLVAIQKLEGRIDEETVDFLMAVAGDGWENWQVKVMSIQLLGKIKNPKAVDLLLEIFTSRSLHYRCPAIKTYAAIALGNFREDARIQDILIRGAQSDEPQVREASVQSLGKVGDEWTVPHLILLLNDHSIAIRLNVVYALERLADHRVVPFLKILSEKDNDEIVKNAAKNALKNLQNK